MSRNVKKHGKPTLVSPTITLDASSSRSDESKRFSWDSTLALPEDEFFQVKSVITTTDDLMSEAPQGSPKAAKGKK